MLALTPAEGMAKGPVSTRVGVDPALVESAVQSSVTTAVFGCEREIDQRSDRPVRAQQRVA